MSGYKLFMHRCQGVLINIWLSAGQRSYCITFLHGPDWYSNLIFMALGLFWTSVCLCVFISILLMDRMNVFHKNNFPVDGRVGQFLILPNNWSLHTLARQYSSPAAHREWVRASLNSSPEKAPMSLSPLERSRSSKQLSKTSKHAPTSLLSASTTSAPTLPTLPKQSV